MPAPNLDRPTPEAIEFVAGAALRFARRYLRTRAHAVVVEDYEGAALEAVARAVANFDPALGVRFGTYAKTCFERAPREEDRKLDPVGRARRRELTAGATEQPGDRMPLSLDTTVVVYGGEDGEVLLRDTLTDSQPTPEVQALRLVDAAEVRCLLRFLRPRERLICRRFYWEGATFAAIAAELGVSESRVHQIHKEGLARVREVLHA